MVTRGHSIQSGTGEGNEDSPVRPEDTHWRHKSDVYTLANCSIYQQRL